MLNSMKSGAPEKDKSVAANAPDVMGRMVQPHDQALGEVRAHDKSGNGLLHRLRHVDRRQDRM